MLNKEQYHKRWNKKKVLQRVYKYLAKKMFDESLPGLSLEVGSGIGELKNDDQKIIKIDIQKSKT